MASRRVSLRNSTLTAIGSTSPAARPAPQVHAITPWRRALLWPLVLLVRLWGRSLRFDISDDAVRTYSRGDVPLAFVLWHNRLFLASEIHRRYRPQRPLYALISASKDGALLTAFFSMVGDMHAVRGSSSNFGREAASALIEVQRQGHDIGITPDGPRGPCYELKAGAVIVPRRTGAPVVLIGGEFASAWRLKSWDRFYLPRPFSRVKVTCEVIQPEQLADRDAAVELIRNRLLALNPDAAA